MKSRKIEKFEAALESIKVPPNLDVEQQENLMKPISAIVEDMLPAQLYRFRQCSERNFDAFYKNQIWVSKGSDVNDAYDTCLYYDDKKIKDCLEKSLHDERFYLKILKLNNMENIPKPIKDFFPDQEIEKRLEIIQQLSQQDIEKVIFDLEQYIQENLPEKLGMIIPLIQQGVKFACFSENIKSAMMWGHYAENGTGFALGYDFRNGKLNNCPECDKLGKECFYPMLCHIYPIIYKNERYDATEYAVYMFQCWLLSEILNKCGFVSNPQLIDEVIPCPDYSMLSKISIHKSLEWEDEKEWRLFCSNKNPNFFYEAHSYVTKAPVAIYLGRKIGNINEKILKDIAKEKGIECYKMDLNKSKVYELKPIEQNM